MSFRALRSKPVPGFPGYEVREDGKVFGERGELWLQRGQYVTLSRRGRSEKMLVAYLVARVFLRNPELRPFVVHRNGDKEDNRVENLEWSEYKEKRMSKKRK